MHPHPRKKNRVPLRSISGNVLQETRPLSDTDVEKKKNLRPSALKEEKTSGVPSIWTEGKGEANNCSSSSTNTSSAQKRTGSTVAKMVHVYLHKSRHVRSAIARLLKATPEPRYNELLRGLLTNLNKITTFLEKNCRNVVHMTSSVKAQFMKCRGWLEMVVVPFYKNLMSNPAACMALLSDKRAHQRKEWIRRISACSNRALRRAGQCASSRANNSQDGTSSSSVNAGPSNVEGKSAL